MSTPIPPTPAATSSPAATATLTMIRHIEGGQADPYLLRLRVAIEARRHTDGYRAHLEAGCCTGHEAP
jgi:hypothetical protein